MPVHSSIDIENPKQTISTCFKMMHYCVPAFQREYVWGDTEIEQLLADIEEAFSCDPQKEYFLGTTVVYKDGDKLQLIDGQQRMTTFFLVLCAIAKKYKSMNDPASAYEQLIYSSSVDTDGISFNSYSLELQYENSTECLSRIWENRIPDELDSLSESSQRLYSAYDTIEKYLNERFTDYSEYRKFSSYFLSKVVFIQIGATNMADALKIFETINQRGVTLNPMDLLKNMLFMQVSESQFDRLNGKWKSMIEDLEKINEKPLRFLRYYITATFDISDIKPDYQGIINEDDIYYWLSKNNDKCHYKESPIKFTDDMIDGLKRYKCYLYPDDTLKGRNYLIDIKAVMGQSFHLHLVSLLSAKGMDDDLRAKLFKVFDSVVYYAVVNRIKSNVLERLFSSWCPSIRNITDKTGLDSFIKNKVIPTLDNWNSSYKQNFMTLSLAKFQRYKIKAILARLSKYVDDFRANSINTAPEIKEYLKASNEIEHIMPDTCARISDYGFSDQEAYDVCKNLLGNLTLLEKTLNGSIQNKDYTEKTSVYTNSQFYLTKSLKELVDVGDNTAINRMNEELNSWETWNEKTITERQEMLCALSRKIWNVSD